MAEQVGLLNVLIIEDEEEHQRWIRRLVTAFGVQHTEIASTGAKAEALLRTGRYNCAIVDLDLPEGRQRGMQILENATFDSTFKIMLTKFADEHVAALLHGARRFISKAELSEDADRLKLALYDAALFVRHALAIHYQSDVMARLYRRVAAVARLDDSVLIVGESGTGKELVAHAIHRISGRAGGPFEALNCACLDPNSAEAELFGVQAGGFTGASARPGIFERANGGTIFFDEIGELGDQEQKRLLRILENPGELRRAGGHTRVQVDGGPVSFRCVFATDRDIRAAVDEGKFHRALFERISTHLLEVPPLNERREDIPLLTRLYFQRHQQDLGRLRSSALDALRAADWAGSNVRGLWNVLARALVLAETREDLASAAVTADDVKEAVNSSKSYSPKDVQSLPSAILQGRMSLNDVEALYIEQVLNASGGRISEAARTLGIGRNTLYDKIRRYRLERLLPRPAGLST